MRVKVPASIANMGPGFDCLAMAIDLWLEVEAEPAEHSSWDYEGEGADYLAAHVNPFSKLQMKGRVKSAIPLGVGLGSSGAARLAASALMSPWDVTSHTIDASSEEGHADNVAASAKGGLVLVVSDHVHEALPDPGWDLPSSWPTRRCQPRRPAHRCRTPTRAKTQSSMRRGLGC